MILGGAGGVPSIAIQLARGLTGLTVVATASRPESEQWVRALGAQHVVNHAKPLKAGIEALGLQQALRYVFSTHTDAQSWADIAGAIAFLADPRGGWINGQTILANGGFI